MSLPRFRRAAERLAAATDGVTVGLCLLLVVASILTGIGIQPATADTQPINSCTTITEPGTYELTSDLETALPIGDACIQIEASGVVFDGNGHTLQGNGTGRAIGLGECCTNGPDNVVVRDVEVVHFTYGITAYGTSNIRIQDVRVVWSDARGPTTGNGIYLFNGSDIVVEDSTVVNAESYAVDVTGGVDIVIRNNWIVDNNGGLNLHGANHLVVDNLVENNGGTSLWTYGGGNHTVRNNTVVNGTRSGIVVNNASAVVNNVVRNNGHVGIEVGRNGVVTGNRIVNNEQGGILLDQDGNLIYDNYLENERNVVGPEGEAPTVGATWNIDPRSGMNVVGGSVLGGNFWAKPNGTGYSETCTDADANGICDDPYSIPRLSQADSRPLADPATDGSSETTTTTTSTTTTRVETTTAEMAATTTETTTATTVTTTTPPTATTTMTETVEETTTATTQTTTATSSDSDGSASDSESAGTSGSGGGGASGGQTDDPTTTTVTPTATETTQTTTIETTQTTRTTRETTTVTATEETTVTTTTTVGTTANQPTETTSVAGDYEWAATTTESAPFSSAAVPGYGFVVVLVALLGGAVLVLRRG